MIQAEDNSSNEAIRALIDFKDGSGKTISELQEESSRQYGNEADSYWNGLTPEQRMKAFYAVCKRIYQGDIKDRGSYRHVLYTIFGFDRGAYSLGIDCGYMDIHNSIYTKEDIESMTKQNAIANEIVESEQFAWLMAGSNHVESNLHQIRPAYNAWKEAGGKCILKKMI